MKKSTTRISLIASALLVGLNGYAAVTGSMLEYNNGVTATSNSTSNIVSSNASNEEVTSMVVHNNTPPFTNHADITASTTGDTSNAFGIQIRTDFVNNGIVSATTTGTNSNAYGIDYYYDGLDLTNNGTITADSANANAYAIQVVTSNQTIINSANAIIAAYKNGALSKDAYALYNADDAGLLTITNNGSMSGNINSTTTTLTNTGLVELPYNANGADSATLTTFTNNANGTLKIDLLTTDSSVTGKYSQLNVTGTAIFADTSTLAVNVLTAENLQSLITGQTLADVVSAGTLDVQDTITVTDNSSLLNFAYVIDGNTIDLTIAQVQTGTYQERAQSAGGNQGTQLAAAAAEAAGIDFVGINDGDDVRFVEAVKSTTPVATTASITANTQILNGVQGIVEMRQNNILGGMNSGDLTIIEKSLWAKVYGSKGQQDNKNGINGFDVNAYGIGIGADGEIAPKQRIGVALFYTHAKVDVNNMNQNSDLDVYTALVYGNAPINAKTDFLYQAGYTWQKSNSDRRDFFNDQYTADFTAKTVSLDLKLMQNYKLDNGLSIRPLIETTYRHYTSPSYTENGTGTVGALSVEKFTSTQLIASTGAIAEYKIAKDSKIITDIRLGYDFHHDEQTVTSSYAGGYSFTTNGIENGGWQYDIGIGYETLDVLGGELNFMYNYQGQGNSFDNHVFSAKYVYKF